MIFSIHSIEWKVDGDGLFVQHSCSLIIHNSQFRIKHYVLLVIIPSRFPQILKYQLHLSSGEVAILDAVASSQQLIQETVGIVDISIEAA